MNKFSERLRELRKENNLSTMQLGKAIGVSDATICHWENAQNDEKISQLIKLALYFNVSSDYLIGLED